MTSNPTQPIQQGYNYRAHINFGPNPDQNWQPPTADQLQAAIIDGIADDIAVGPSQTVTVTVEASFG